MKTKAKRRNRLSWLFEPFEDDPRFLKKRLFSMEAVYLGGKLYLAIGDGEEPWSGLMVCTSRERHAAITADYPQLKPHEILGKWLYLSQLHPEFESVAPELVALALNRDPRIGVIPAARSKRRKTAAASRRRVPDAK